MELLTQSTIARTIFLISGVLKTSVNKYLGNFKSLPVRNAMRSIGISFLILAFLLSASSSFSAVFRKAPYLLYPKSNTKAEIYWQLDVTNGCTFNYGLTAAYGTTINTAEYGTDHQHKVQLAGLSVNTKYYYQVTIGGGTSVTGSFRTGAADDATSVSFYAYGDTRSQPSIHNTVCEKVVADFTANPACQTFIIVSGDLVSDGNTEPIWDSELFRSQDTKIREMMASIPYMASLGNHEGNGTLFAKYFPYQFYAGSRYYYSFDYGPAHFTIIDQYTTYTAGSTQYNWIVSDLSSSNKPWKFILLHEPGWSASGGHENNTTVQTVLQPLAETYGVQFFIAGHNHYYARATVNNVQHITAGGGGAPLHTPNPAYPNIVKTDGSYNFCKININGENCDVSAIRSNGTVIESFSLVRNLSVTLTSPVSGTTFVAPATLTLSAAVSDNSRVQKVDFYNGSTLVGTDTSAPFSVTWSNVVAGTCSITAKATDTYGATVSSSPASVIVYDPVLPNTVSSLIAAGTDDAEQSASGSVNTTSTDMELVNDSGTGAGDQTVGLRFTNLMIPQGAQITSAYVQFTCDETNNLNPCTLTIKGEKTAASATFSTTSGSISGRTKTTASVSWSPTDWTVANAAGTIQQTPQIAGIVQEIVNLPSFLPASPVTLIINGTGRRTAWSKDGTGTPARLVVEFTLQSQVTPVFNPIGPLCQNSTSPALPPTSTNGITGTWNPAVISTATPGTTVYTFTPNPGQNAVSTTMSIVVTAPVIPVFTQIGPLYQGKTPPDLPLTSTNGITGTWIPSVISTTETGIFTYAFTPTAGLCATTASMQIEILPKAYPVVSITSPAQGAVFTAPATINITASASDADGTIVNVAFYQGTTHLGNDAGAPYSFTWSGVSQGSYQLTAVARDDDGQETTSSIVGITVNPPLVTQIFEKRIILGSDDAEEYNAGTMLLGSDDIELVYDSKTTGNQKVGLRFQTVTIPKGATITNAFIRFTTDETKTGTTSLLIQGLSADNVTTFTTSKKNISSRAKTVSSVSWAPSGWSTIGASGDLQKTPDLKSIVQEIISRNLWTSGNSLAFIISGTGTRTAVAFETNPAASAFLHIEYTMPPAMKSAPVNDIASLTPVSLKGMLTCYPVPVTGELNILFEPGENEITGRVEIFNAMGSMLHTIETSENFTRVAMDNYPAGIYLIGLQTNRNHYVKTVIKK